MDTQALKNEVDALEQAADDVIAALKKSPVEGQLQQQAQQFHQLARTKRELNDGAALQQAVMDIEKSADQLKAACEQAGSVDASVKQAVMGAHDKASALKHRVQQQQQG